MKRKNKSEIYCSTRSSYFLGVIYREILSHEQQEIQCVSIACVPATGQHLKLVNRESRKNKGRSLAQFQKVCTQLTQLNSVFLFYPNYITSTKGNPRPSAVVAAASEFSTKVISSNTQRWISYRVETSSGSCRSSMILGASRRNPRSRTNGNR